MRGILQQSQKIDGCGRAVGAGCVDHFSIDYCMEQRASDAAHNQRNAVWAVVGCLGCAITNAIEQ